MKPEIAEQFKRVLGAQWIVQHGELLASACTDFFGHWQGRAEAILYPATTEETAACLKICNQCSMSVTVQGGKTGLVAGSVPSQSGSGVILNLQRLKAIREVDVPNRSVVVEAGVTIAELNSHLALSNLHLPISIGSDSACQIGGMISTNAGGHGVFRYGMSRHQLLGVEAVLGDGRILSNLRALRKDNVGYDFGQLLCGAEGTLGVVTLAALKVLPLPRQCVTIFLAIRDIETVIDLYTQLSFDLSEFLSAFELIPAAARQLVETHVKDSAPPDIEHTQWYILLQAETTSATLPLESLVSESLQAALRSGDVVDAVIAQSESQRAQLWKFRENVVFSQRKHGPVLPHDLSVRVSKIPELLERGREAVTRICKDVSFVTFGHVGDGNLHFNIVHNGPDCTFRETYGAAIELALCEVVSSLDGSISAEHGIGRKKQGLVHFSRDSTAVDLMKSTRRCFDSALTLNREVLF
jgi:FAD/FMN-containing dehydrogenase